MSYYNIDDSKSVTFLEFGSIDLEASKKNVWDLRLHQEAYDFFMIARYFKDLLTYRNLVSSAQSEPLEVQLRRYREGVYTRDLYNSFSKLAALSVIRDPSPPSFVELGSTLMGCIDGMRFVRSRCTVAPPVDLQRVVFRGIDISALLNDGAKALYPDFTLETFLDLKSCSSESSVFFAKGVSLLYALREVEDLLSALTLGRVCVFDYSFALGERQTQYLGTGKQVAYLPLSQVQAALRSAFPKRTLLVQKTSALLNRDEQRLRAVFYFGEEQILRKIIVQELDLKRQWLMQIGDPDARRLLFYNEQETPLVDDFAPVAECGWIDSAR